MAKKLQLFKPVKPFVVTQKWGNKPNPPYPASFKYTLHNGVDLALDEDVQVEAMIEGTATVSEWSDTNGWYVRYRTNEMYEVEGKVGYVEFIYGHGSKLLVQRGERVYAGKPVIIAGNTGYSFGPHTHISAYLLDANGKRIPFDPATDNTFDWTKYVTDDYTADIWLVIKKYISFLKDKVSF
jgi:murein DD-endopeptidase MepM/ murein hydrolase activator NlpD